MTTGEYLKHWLTVAKDETSEATFDCYQQLTEQYLSQHWEISGLLFSNGGLEKDEPETLMAPALMLGVTDGI
jgi:hypothetical protein